MYIAVEQGIQRRMIRGLSPILGVVIAGVLGCDPSQAAPSASSSATPAPESAAAPAPSCSPPPRAQTVEPKPQSGRYHGGWLENFDYFYGDINALPTTKKFVGKLSHGGRVEVSVVKSGEDPCIKEEKVPLYTVHGQIEGEWRSLCANEALPEPLSSCEQGSREALREKAIAIPGYWERRTGVYMPDCGKGKPCFTLACLPGAAAKCVHWGYRVWEDAYTDAQGRKHDLRPYYEACTHAARAQYLGEGTGFTCDGTTIDVYDRLGLQKRDEAFDRAHGLAFESLWSAKGLHCMARPRWQGCDEELGSGAALLPGKPCLDPVSGAGAAWPTGALVGVMSSPANDSRARGTGCPSNPWNCPALLDD
ncbi:ADYC domain-containing protein [Sorangium sp. So ce131]|uniref:ADYC domain-containing protein n=1 Tax=Sorangium sp. So ce131 TaxID=3133282 RepID=UPI003F646EF1